MADPNNVLLADYRVVFGLPCKNANTSIKTALYEAVHGQSPRDAGVNVHRLDWHVALPYEDAVRVYHVVRDPLDRLISCWGDKVVRRLHPGLQKFGINGNTCFGEFVDIIAEIPDEQADQHFRSQSYDLQGYADRTLYFETLAIGWKQVQRDMWRDSRLVIEDLKRLNATETVVFPGKKTLAKVHRRYEDDYRRWYPRKL